MMKRDFSIVLISLILIRIMSCTQNASISKDVQVATSIFPISDIAKNIAGNKAEVFFVVPDGANPHTYEPVPSVVKKLQHVDLFLGIHPDFDGWIEDYLPEKAKLTFLNRTFYEDDHTNHDHSQHDDYEDEKSHQHRENPHIWLSVRNAKRIAERITLEFVSLDEKNRSQYEKNLNSYLNELDRLDDKIAALFETVKMKMFIQYHPAWDFFAKDYGLDIAGTIESGHGDEPSVRELKRLIEKAKENQVKVIVIGLNLESKAAEVLKREIHGVLVRLDSIGSPKLNGKSNFLEMMNYNAKTLADALNTNMNP